MRNTKKHVLCGADRPDVFSDLIRDKRVALLTSASGITQNARPSYMKIAGMCRLSYLLTPEHGLFSAMQAGEFGDGSDTVHPGTGARIVTMTSKLNPALDTVMSECDVAIYDIQDVGARYYTYLSSLTQLMRVCAKYKKRLIVLDRPNPVGGTRFEGLTLDEEKYASFIGEYAIPVRYGMTIGEYAGYVNQEKGIGCPLFVVPMSGWTRDTYYDETDLLWVSPSPNIPVPSTCFNYLATCFLEATNVSEGRGTARPFDWIGAPFLDGEHLSDYMSSAGLDGAAFRPIAFTPTFSKHAGLLCSGIEIHVTDRDAYRPFDTSVYLLSYLYKVPGFSFKQQSLCLRMGRDVSFDGKTAEAWIAAAQRQSRAFYDVASGYFLYD